jgi:hypothetical protein
VTSGRRGGSLREEARQSNQEVYDKLIDVFMQKTPEEWRKLIAFSKQWPSLADGVLKRLKERAEAADDASRGPMLRTARQLRAVSDDMARFSDLLAAFSEAPGDDWESLVMRHRPAMGADFFAYIELKARAAGATAAADAERRRAAGQQVPDDEGPSPEQEAIASLAVRLAALVEAHDRVAGDTVAMEAAVDAFTELLNAADSLPAAEAKIDELAASGRLNPALLLTMAKAYASAKESNMTREEVKDVMAHLYFKAKETFSRQAPAEVRILKHLLTIDSPNDRRAALDQAFERGPEMTMGAEDLLCTTPVALLNTIENVLGVYERSRGAATMAGQAADLMQPEVVERMKILKDAIRKHYM